MENLRKNYGKWGFMGVVKKCRFSSPKYLENPYFEVKNCRFRGVKYDKK